MPDSSKPSTPPPKTSEARSKTDPFTRVIDKINASDNILIALSDNPSVDELSAAIGLTMLLDRINKHATAIFSGQIPNTIEFLKPEETLEKNTDSLRDFIVALNKEKADHIRYMIEGDFVRIYITPYRTVIDEKDLSFAHGEYNVDLVIAFNVQNSEDLDDALTEYGRIAHDATAINISNGVPGHFAEIEWTSSEASSTCEMVVKLADRLGVTDFDQDIATALLTGIVAATERFSNSRTTPETLTLASRLMSFGADQQLISNNIMDKKVEPTPPPAPEEPKKEETPPAPVDTTPEEDLIPTPASTTTHQTAPVTPTPEPEPAPTPSITLTPEPAPTILPDLAPATTPATDAPAPATPATPPATPDASSPTPPPIITPTINPTPVAPAPAPTPAVPAQPSANINPAAQAAPNLTLQPDIISFPQLDYEQIPAPTQSLDQQIQPVTSPPDYGAMIDAELATPIPPAPSTPSISPSPSPATPTAPPSPSIAVPPTPLPNPTPVATPAATPSLAPTPEPIPLPPLPMPPAPQPLATTPIEPAQPISPAPQPAPISPPESSVAPTPQPATPPQPIVSPQPSPIDNASFQIPNLPQ